jgi:hypothetical protein
MAAQISPQYFHDPEFFRGAHLRQWQRDFHGNFLSDGSRFGDKKNHDRQKQKRLPILPGGVF